jgi:hypothetical protein
MARSKYNYIIDGNFIFITDLNGAMSVTNDIENVLSEISKDLNTSMDNFKIVYQDSYGDIDGIKTINGSFKGFYFIGAKTFYEAKLKF